MNKTWNQHRSYTAIVSFDSQPITSWSDFPCIEFQVVVYPRVENCCERKEFSVPHSTGYFCQLHAYVYCINSTITWLCMAANVFSNIGTLILFYSKKFSNWCLWLYYVHVIRINKLIFSLHFYGLFRYQCSQISCFSVGNLKQHFEI